MVKKMKIYIAGPYCPRNCSLHDASRIAYQNTLKAIKAFHALKERGHYPFVPHLSHYIHIHGNKDYGDWWYEFDLTFLEDWADAILSLGNSKGADMEVKRAKQLGLKVYYKIEEIPIKKQKKKGQAK